MPLSTRAVLALLVGSILLAGMIAPRVGRGVLGSWLLAVGMVGATLWGGLSVAWARSNPSALSPRLYLVLTATTMVGAIYYGQRAHNDEPPAAIDRDRP